MTAELIHTLLPCLPRFAEEEGDYFSVKRETLAKHLTDAGYPKEIAENSLAMLECLLDTLATLNPDALQKDEWCFVSFPAQLIAVSVLTALSDTDSRLFADNFWNTQGIANDKKNRQRDVLRTIETARFENHIGRQAPPVRYCYVAWSIIKRENKILFYQREDTQKRYDKTAGDYGLIGGRANQNDVPITDKESLLKELQSAHSTIIQQALPETLKRELKEEAGLCIDSHYQFKLWRRLKPYRQIQGAAPNHALTEYYLDIFHIDLSLEGYLFLQQKTESDERLVWFSIEDMVKGESSDGKIPYIKALYDDFSDDRSALEAALMELPNSFSSRYLFQPSKYGLTLPLDHKKPILAGTLGKEKPLDLNLTARELDILLGLASHLRGFSFSKTAEGITFHPYGWIEVDNISMQSELIHLASALKETDLVIENHRDQFFRFSISPEVVFFDEKLFSFIVKADDLDSSKTKIPMTIQRKYFETALGNVDEKNAQFSMSIELINSWKKLYEHDYSSDNEIAVKFEDNYKKGLHKNPEFSAMGLRRLIRRDAGIMKFVATFKIISETT